MVVAEHQGDQQAPDAAIAVQKWVNDFELHMGEGRFNDGSGRFEQVLLEIPQTGIQVGRRRRHEGRIAGPSTSDPVLRAAKFTGLLLCTASIGKQDAVHFA